MNKLIIILLVACTFFCCKSSQKATQAPVSYPDSENLATIIKEYEALIQSKNASDPWPDYSEESVENEKNNLKKLLSDLNTITIAQITEPELINKDLLTLVIEDRLFELDFESYTFPLDSEGGFMAGIIYGMRGFPVRDEESYQKYLAKLKALPAYFESKKVLMKKGQAIGKSSPKLIVENCIKRINQIFDSASDDTFLIQPVKDNSTYKAEANTVIQDEILPAYLSFRDFLKDEYLKNAPKKIGISDITDGKAFYEQRTRYYTTFDISPEEVFEIGQKEVKRIRKEMQTIIEKIEFEGTFEDFLWFLRNDDQFYAQTPQEILDHATRITNRTQKVMPQYFGNLPRMPLTVQPVPAALAPNYTGGRYSPGSYSNQKAGEYWVNTYDLPSRPLYTLPALSLHEGVPGHHTQIMLAAEIPAVPDFRKRTYLSAYGEGWALYSEYLGKEAGLYVTPYEDFGRLVYEMWRACRLVVDPGMHYKGWSRKKAFEFMKKNTALSIVEINSEIDRYIGWPGQAVSYKMGELKIKELRQLASDELGDKFDLRTFHDIVLANGSVPLNTLERIVRNYIDDVNTPIETVLPSN